MNALSNTTSNLKFLRESFHLSQAQFAELTGRTQAMVSKWEEGLFSPNAETLFRIVNAFHANYGVRIDLNQLVVGTISL